jgi:hypothetical protein
MHAPEMKWESRSLRLEFIQRLGLNATSSPRDLNPHGPCGPGVFKTINYRFTSRYIVGMEIVSIRSSGSSGELKFYNPRTRNKQTVDHFDVSLELIGVQGALTVYPLEVVSLEKFFGELARDWKGWKGERKWASLEDELTLSASCDRLGHIFLGIRLQSSEWSLQGFITLEAGQLAGVHRDIGQFLGIS